MASPITTLSAVACKLPALHGKKIERVTRASAARPPHVRCTMSVSAGSKHDDEATTLPKAAQAAAAISTLLPAAPALAEEASDKLTIGGLDVNTYVFSLAPILLYGGFTVFRTTFNPNLKISDFFFSVACLVIFGNIFSILLFKTRLF
mmetsp:Transcript_47049/g.89840  ORF Transcript_47049/g.89840 Transcript_47049/m.89840 type:complete len:148 (-) Transcript_47049:172-615(-)|eukprot:CAMPEP_0114301328 /NCGR_PEP_ID=MMETSP0059-20121206/14043_1 /TAXON_ID=36894 /ORGANISM="Pyramimonas parkeae, Strain CCMP726" /LENGTH=147 /DNA_ID=CAMNT_0001424049 /DNA_START=61 /DNA_END=504 /DNA_ORIENTATION=+